MYGFQSMRTYSTDNINTDNTEDDDLMAAALQNEELTKEATEHQNIDTFSKIYEFFSSLWSGEETQKKQPRTYDYHKEILPSTVQLDTALRVEHFGGVVEMESHGASFKPLNVCQQPTNVYISAATCRECLPHHQGELPSSFLAYLHRMWSPSERDEAVKKHANKASSPKVKDEGGGGLNETTRVRSQSFIFQK